MSASIKTLLVLLCVFPLIIWISMEIGDGDYTIPVIAGLLIIGSALNRILAIGVRYDAYALSLLVIGYLVGNRGFAQVSPSQSAPLFVGEMAMVSCLLYLIVQKILSREPVIPKFPLSKILACFLLYGGIRLSLNFREYGTLAIRDSAMVYYALFFYFAYETGLQERSRNFFEKCLLVGLIALIPTNVIQHFYPETYEYIAFRGVPLIYQKGDLVGIFFSMGALVFFCASYQSRWPKMMVMLTVLSSGMMLLNGARAGLVALIIPAVYLSIARLNAFFRYQAAILALIIVGTLSYAVATNTQLADMQSFGLYEKFIATLDVNSDFNYQTESSGASSASNNQFRLVWWQTVIGDTIEHSPWVGLGFGYDLTEHFSQVYYGYTPEQSELRSPHSYIVTIFGRLGLIGLFFVLALFYCLLRETMRSALEIRHGRKNYMRLGLWLAALSVFVGGCFGVVLEGPMGGILFWSLLGVACAHDRLDADRKFEELPPGIVKSLRLRTNYRKMVEDDESADHQESDAVSNASPFQKSSSR